MAEDGSRRRVCGHAELYAKGYIESVGLQSLQERLIEVAYEAFDSARRKVP